MTSFWDHHGVFFLIFITLFPRLTLLFSSVVSGGFFWWLGFIFTPRLLVAILATTAYWETDPILVAISWFVAFSGEFREKLFFKRRMKIVYVRPMGPSRRSNNQQQAEREVREAAIETDFERLN